MPLAWTSPFQNFYWVVPKKFLAGPYPSSGNLKDVRLKVNELMGLGVTSFLDLTEPGEKGLNSYAPILNEGQMEWGAVEYHRMPIADFDIPTFEIMEQILSIINKAMNDGKVLYVHCFAGIGRTGTVIGCYLAERGFRGEESLLELDRLHKGTRFEGAISILTMDQLNFVKNWNRG